MNENLTNYELERKKIRKNGTIMTLVSVFLVVCGLLGMVLLARPEFIIIAIIVSLVLLIIQGNKKSKFTKNLKSNVITAIIKEELGDDAIYQVNNGIPVDDVVRLGVYQVPDRWHVEDYIKAKYNDIEFEMSDMVLEDRRVTRDSDGNTRVEYITYFKGRVIRIDFKKDMNFKLKIIEGRPNGLELNGYQSVETEVIEFNKKYNTYANDKEQAFYYLTPYFIQKLLELEKLFRGSIQFVMDGDYFYVLINNSGDSLEVSFAKPIDENMVNIIRSQVTIGPAIINELRLDKDKFNMNIKI